MRPEARPAARPEPEPVPASSGPLRPRGGSIVYRARPRWKLAVLTGLAACVAAIAVLT
jgi:hypothetical protein